LKSTHKVTIEKLVPTGYGLARIDGLVCFVPYVLPQEEVLVQIVEKKKNYAVSQLVEVIRPSPDRISPKCAVFGLCGGCNWQHIPHSMQLDFKSDFIKETLSNYMNLTSPMETIRSPESYNYRNRIKLKYENSKIGYYSKASHQHVEIESCPIAEHSVNTKIQQIKEINQPGEYLVTKTAVQFVDKKNPALDFFQVNDGLNQLLIEKVILLVERFQTKDLRIWDFYCGRGNFTFPLLEKIQLQSIYGVELNSAAVAAAHAELVAKNLSPKKIRIFCGKAEHLVKTLPIAPNDLVLVDPPRSGCDPNFLKGFVQTKCQNLIYISCNLATLVRDLKLLIQLGAKPSITRIFNFDMFPQTSHTEVLAEIQVDLDLPRN
jgi:23S rRNA (uracil1939-C5)-methyltransferase